MLITMERKLEVFLVCFKKNCNPKWEFKMQEKFSEFLE
jgi:hypothetical protein